MTAAIEQALGELYEICGADLVNELLDLFLEQAPLHLAAARDAVQSGDARTAERSVHTLKSNAAQLGLEPLSVLCARMEAMAKAGKLAALPPLLGQALEAIAAAAPELRRIRAEGLPTADGA
jgi:HPt (histidine-containing phosphotransfer) domain-containing protein